MRHADRPTLTESVHVSAPPDRVWPLVSDIAFVVGTSDELQGVRWADDADGPPCVGRRFVGRNANRYFGEWETTCTVIECDEPTAFAWAVGDVAEPNTTWRFTLSPDAGGTTVGYWMQLGVGDSGLTVAIGRRPDKEEKIVAGRLAEFRAAMQAHLAAIERAAEGS